MGVGVGVCVGDVLCDGSLVSLRGDLGLIGWLCAGHGRLTGRPVEEEKRARRGVLGAVK